MALENNEVFCFLNLLKGISADVTSAMPFQLLFLTHARSSLVLVVQPVAATINTLAGALYKVFCDSPDLAMKEMRQACFDYLSIGGVFSSGPVALLSGLNPRPLSLVVHFFAVAVYGVGRLLVPFPSPSRVWIGARLLRVRPFFFSFKLDSIYLRFLITRYLVQNQIAICLRFHTSFHTTILRFLHSFATVVAFQGAANIIFPIIKAEGVRQMFFPNMVPAYYKAPPAEE